MKKNQAKSEYERELINFVNPSDYPEKIPRKKLHISKDFPTTRPHRLGTSSVRVMKDAGMKGITKDIPATITSRNDNATTTDVQPTIDTSSSIVCHIKKNCNQLAKQIGVMKKEPKSYTTDFFLKEVQSIKEISLDL